MACGSRLSFISPSLSIQRISHANHPSQLHTQDHELDSIQTPIISEPNTVLTQCPHPDILAHFAVSLGYSETAKTVSVLHVSKTFRTEWSVN